MGGYCKEHWFQKRWDQEWINAESPSIEYLELMGVVVSVFLFADDFINSRICLFCDNQAMVSMINNATSSCKNCMVLIRLLTLRSLESNVRVFAHFVDTKQNYFADALSHFQDACFWFLAEKYGHHFNTKGLEIPDELWPIQKLWIS